MPGATRPKRSRDRRATKDNASNNQHPHFSYQETVHLSACRLRQSRTEERGEHSKARRLPLTPNLFLWSCWHLRVSAAQAAPSTMSVKRLLPEQIADRARCNGYESGKHEERDRQTGITNYSPQILVEQERVLHIYAV